MSDLKKTRHAQNLLSAVFEWNFDDTMDNTSGVSKNFGSSDLTGMTADVIKLPPNSIVVGGHLTVTTAFDTAGYDVTVGDSGSSTRYMASTDVKATGTTALLTPGYVNVDGLDIRISVATDDVCTTGKARLVVNYIVEDRVSENM